LLYLKTIRSVDFIRTNKLNITTIFKNKKIAIPTVGAGTVPRKTLEESAYEPFSRSLRRGIPEMYF
jgi:hypothetical protein